jgi:hypothetical protein
MGLSLFSDAPSFSRTRRIESSSRKKKPVLGEPNPRKCNLLDWDTHGDLSAALVHYEGCESTFGGRKILVLVNTSYEDFVKTMKSEGIDPHFIEGQKIIARFVPTNEGWLLARAFIRWGGGK